MARFSYGGQALIEGVLMRGRNGVAVALRHPDGRIAWADERLGAGFRATRAARLPLLRGLVVLYETLVVGTRWLVRSASVAAAEPDATQARGGGQAAPVAPVPETIGDAEATNEPGPVRTTEADPPTRVPAAPSSGPATGSPVGEAGRGGEAGPGGEAGRGGEAGPGGEAPDGLEQAPATGVDLGRGAVALMLGITLVVGVGLFFFLPATIARFVAGSQDPLVERAVEAIVQISLFIGYLLVISRTGEVRRTFMYHGAEHMTIHALEAGDPLTVDAVRTYPTAHPRCGTEFLVVVILVSIVTFSLVGRHDLLYTIASRVVLIPVIAAVSYELLRFGARHRGRALVRWIFQPGIWVQRITTRQPTEDMMEVAIVAMEQALRADGEALPQGSGHLARVRLTVGSAAAAGSEA